MRPPQAALRPASLPLPTHCESTNRRTKRGDWQDGHARERGAGLRDRGQQRVHQQRCLWQREQRRVAGGATAGAARWEARAELRAELVLRLACRGRG